MIDREGPLHAGQTEAYNMHMDSMPVAGHSVRQMVTHVQLYDASILYINSLATSRADGASCPATTLPRLAIKVQLAGAISVLRHAVASVVLRHTSVV